MFIDAVSGIRELKFKIVKFYLDVARKVFTRLRIQFKKKSYMSLNNIYIIPPRDKLLPPHTGPQEYRFNGRAHVTMPGRGYLTPQKNQILLFFRTYAPNGLIYLVGEGAYFFSIQMQDGRVFLQVRNILFKSYILWILQLKNY